MRKVERKICRETTACPEIRCAYCPTSIECHMEWAEEESERQRKEEDNA